MEKPQILWIASSYVIPQECIKTHTHPYYHMFLAMNGALRFVIEGETFYIHPGQCRRAYPADILTYPEDKSATHITNEFMYSVLAQKKITPQMIEKLNGTGSKQIKGAAKMRHPLFICCLFRIVIESATGFLAIPTFFIKFLI